MSEAVLDASAVLAILNDEPGAEEVAAVLKSAAVSAVNLSEVVGKLADDGVAEAATRDALDELHLRVVPFDRDQAFAAGSFRPVTRRAGLSLADRACIALAQQLDVPALTTDRRWAELQLPITLRVIR